MSRYSTEQWAAIIEQIRSTVPKELGEQAWYLLTAAALSASPSPELLSQLYTYLTTQTPDFKSASQHETISLQFRDILLKQVVLIGAPQVLMAFTPLAAAEGSPQDKAKESQLTPKWKNFNVDDIHSRGTDTIYSIYGQKLLHDRIFPQWGHHTADIQFMELFTAYGLYLSDFERLTPLETELVVFVTISCLGLGLGPALWHLRGLGRLLGARGEDENTIEVRKVKDMLRQIKVSIMAVVDFVGEEYVAKAKMDAWPNVGDVSRVLNGWGEDA